MSSSINVLVSLGALALLLIVLHRNLWRAVLCIAPSSLTVESEEPPDRMQTPLELAPLARELGSLGFSPIGSRREKPKLAAAAISYDYANARDKVFATLFLTKDKRPGLYYLTPTQSGGFVITANYRRPSREIPGVYLSGALEDFPADRVYRAHLRRIEQMRPAGDYTQEGRLAAAKAWFFGPGRSEVRQQNLQGLVWTAGTLGILAAALFGHR